MQTTWKVVRTCDYMPSGPPLSFWSASGRFDIDSASLVAMLYLFVDYFRPDLGPDFDDTDAWVLALMEHFVDNKVGGVSAHIEINTRRDDNNSISPLQRNSVHESCRIQRHPAAVWIQYNADGHRTETIHGLCRSHSHVAFSRSRTSRRLTMATVLLEGTLAFRTCLYLLSFVRMSVRLESQVHQKTCHRGLCRCSAAMNCIARYDTRRISINEKLRVINRSACAW
ncbi:hypothetical protein DFH29DRAFT_248486 [Suillus ampliporus]|nr:hypothetical protein DFH29DRAFT_248486 [Suillus ampliporus]